MVYEECVATCRVNLMVRINRKASCFLIDLEDGVTANRNTLK
jgi:hypothetical protein